MSPALLLGILQLVLEESPAIVEAVAKALSPTVVDLTDEHQAQIDLIIAQGALAALQRAQAETLTLR